MKFSLENIVKTYRQHMPDEFLLLNQTSDRIEFTFLNKRLKTRLQKLKPNESLDLNENQSRQWSITKSEHGARRFDMTVDEIVTFEKTDSGQIINSTFFYDSKLSPGRIHVGPNIMTVDGSDFFYDMELEYRFYLHPEIQLIMPAIWHLYGISDDLLEKMLHENPAINNDVIWAFLGSSTKADVLQKLYPDVRLFDGIEDMHFDLACRFAEAQKHIVSKDLDYFVDTVSRDCRQYLPIVTIWTCTFKNKKSSLVWFLDQVYQVNLLHDKYDFVIDGKNPETGGLLRSYFDTQISKGLSISFSKSIEEIKKEIALQKEAENIPVFVDGSDIATDDLPF